MANLLIILSADDRTTHAMLADAALRHAVRESGCKLDVDVRGPDAVLVIDTAVLATAEAVVWAGLVPDAAARHANLRTLEVTLDEVLADARAVLAHIIGNAPPIPKAGAQAQYIVAITSCPTGIMHTFMAAETFTQAAGALGCMIHMEMQGSVDTQSTLSADAIATADLVLIVADTQVDLLRFTGKRVFRAGTKAATHDGQALVRRAFDEASLGNAETTQLAGTAAATAEQQRTGSYKHPMTGVSFTLPFMVTGGILIALASALGGIYVTDASASHTPGGMLFQVGAKSAFALMVPVLAGYIAYSITDQPGIASGVVGGILAASLGTGFLGGIMADFVASYGTEVFGRQLKLPRSLEGLKPVLVLPVLGYFLTGLVILYVVGASVVALLASLTTWLRDTQGASTVPPDALLGGMMAFGMGDPISKATYTLSIGLIGAQVYTPVTATMVAGTTPSLGTALATQLSPSRFTRDERQVVRTTAVLGLAFISEGAVPCATRDPFRATLAFMAGSACTDVLSILFGVELCVPHGGAFVLLIPNAVTRLGNYVVALVASTVVAVVLLTVMRRRVAKAA